ncbi:MAG: hypothetical protein ACXITV_00455 [Luteibaculaceae bacterium]
MSELKPKQIAELLSSFLTHNKSGSISMNNMKIFQVWNKFSTDELETFKSSIVFAINKKNKEKLEELLAERNRLDELIKSIEKK